MTIELYEKIINERGGTITALRTRIRNIRAAALPVRQVSGSIAAGLKFDETAAVELINALLREIDKEIP